MPLRRKTVFLRCREIECFLGVVEMLACQLSSRPKDVQSRSLVALKDFCCLF